MVTAAVRYKESPLDVVSWNFAAACGRISLDNDLRTLLAMPYRELSLHLPVRMDDGTLRVFRASRYLHSNARGPAAGMIRLSPGATDELARALANATTWTAAIVNIPFGGSCGVIDCDPAQLSEHEYETLVRRFASRSHVVLGPYQDVVMASSESEAAMLLDEYSSLRSYTPAFVTGKSASHGGAAHLSKAHPRAAAIVMREVASRLDRDVTDLRVAIYATAATAADYLAEFISIGASVVALSDGRSTATDERGLNPLTVSECVRQYGSVASYPGTAESTLAADCDVLVLAASECALTAANANRVRASLVLEAAPLSITPSADTILRQQRVAVVPDLLAASGSIIAAHTEWASNLEQKQLQTRDIESEFDRLLPHAVDTIFDRSNRDHSTLRSAAYCIAVEKVSRTERLRGI